MPYLSVMSDTTCLKEALSISISVTNTNLGSLYFSQSSHAFSVPTSMPALPDTTMIAASAVETASSTSPTKSKNPGVSSTLIFTPSHSIGITDVAIEIWRFCSSLPKSLTVFPSSTLPILEVIPDRYAIASTRLVLPQPPCPSKTTLRILSVV